MDSTLDQGGNLEDSIGFRFFPNTGNPLRIISTSLHKLQLDTPGCTPNMKKTCTCSNSVFIEKLCVNSCQNFFECHAHRGACVLRALLIA